MYTYICICICIFIVDIQRVRFYYVINVRIIIAPTYLYNVYKAKRKSIFEYSENRKKTFERKDSFLHSRMHFLLLF